MYYCGVDGLDAALAEYILGWVSVFIYTSCLTCISVFKVVRHSGGRVLAGIDYLIRIWKWTNCMKGKDGELGERKSSESYEGKDEQFTGREQRKKKEKRC